MWQGDEQELVEEKLAEECSNYVSVARQTNKSRDNSGPTNAEVDAAAKHLEDEINTPEFIDSLKLDDVLPSQEQIDANKRAVVDNAISEDPAFRATLDDIQVSVYVDSVGSPNDPYYLNDSTQQNHLIVTINRLHPHFSMLEGQDSVLNYFRHCVYDAIAEYRATKKHSALDSDSIKLIKDKYLRVAFEILQSDEKPEE